MPSDPTTSAATGVAAAVSALGIEIGGTKLQVVLGDAATGHIHLRWRASVRRDQGAHGVLDQIAAGLDQLLADARAAGLPEPRAAAAGFGGPIDVLTGRVRTSHHVGGWDGVDLAAFLASRTGLAAVAADNDANVAALGQALALAGPDGRHPSPLLYVTLGSGVGAGLCIDGRIYHGAPPGECELGHLHLDRKGATVESRCSGWAADRRVRDAVRDHPDSPLAAAVAELASPPGAPDAPQAHPAPGGEARALAPALSARDPVALALLRDLADDLALGLSHAVHLLHPRLITLGGGLALLGEPLRAAVASALPSYLMAAFRPGPDVALATLGEDAVPAGALRLAGQALASRHG